MKSLFNFTIHYYSTLDSCFIFEFSMDSSKKSIDVIFLYYICYYYIYFTLLCFSILEVFDYFLYV